MLLMKFKFGLWIGDENIESETMFPPIDDITWQSPYILAIQQEEPTKQQKKLLFSSHHSNQYISEIKEEKTALSDNTKQKKNKHFKPLKQRTTY